MPTSKGTVHPFPEGAAAARAAELQLVERCRQGELGAFEEVYRQHSGRLYSLAMRMLGNPADAEDLLQEIFLSAHRKLESFRGESALGTWLYRLADRAIDRIDLERALAELPEGCRAAFVLHDVQGLEHREVSDVLGIAEGTSKSQVHKARLRLRGLLRRR